ncbi:MAG: hypothetical protein WC548_02315 [Candidatus Pacearchaeota archaeon]
MSMCIDDPEPDSLDKAIKNLYENLPENLRSENYGKGNNGARREIKKSSLSPSDWDAMLEPKEVDIIRRMSGLKEECIFLRKAEGAEYFRYCEICAQDANTEGFLYGGTQASKFSAEFQGKCTIEDLMFRCFGTDCCEYYEKLKKLNKSI